MKKTAINKTIKTICEKLSDDSIFHYVTKQDNFIRVTINFHASNTNEDFINLVLLTAGLDVNQCYNDVSFHVWNISKLYTVTVYLTD